MNKIMELVRVSGQYGRTKKNMKRNLLGFPDSMAEILKYRKMLDEM